MSPRFVHRVPLAILAGTAVAYAGFVVSGLRVNTTPSVPIGLYRLTDEAPAPGAYVLFCPPTAPVIALAKERGYLAAGWCPGGCANMIKRILAAKDDDVEIGPDGVSVNGVFVSHSRPKTADPAGRPLPRITETRHLDESAVLVMGTDNENSFDSRYFGFLDRAQITGVLRPVWTW